MKILRRKAPKVLVVEDDVNNHLLYRTAFEKAGFEVCVCQNAEDDFVEEVLEVGPDIISMDLMLGSETRLLTRDGFDAIKLLKEDKRTKKIPIFICTNFFTEDKIMAARDLGAVDFINLAGLSVAQVPDIFLRYLKKPRRYHPVHPLFRK